MRARIPVAVLGVAVGATLALAQEDRPPRETVSATLGGKKVSVEYGRPSLKGRTLDALLAQLPPDRIWRAGVNQVTTLETEGDIAIGGTRVPKGKYSLYLHLPAEGPASLVLNTDPGIPLKVIFPQAPPAVADALWPRLDGYDKIKATEVARITLKSTRPPAPVELFQVALAPAQDGVSTLTFSWADRSWTTEVRAA
ncbi:MAG TPA: DUF2911 domain-containing protein [Vicinamibacteria bacterium]